MKKIDIAVVMAALALILASASMYTVYNIMDEVDNMYAEILKIEQSVEHKLQEVMGNIELWDQMQYNSIIIPTSEMNIIARPEVRGKVVRFRYDGDMAIIDMELSLNTTYRLDIYAYSGTQKETTRGSALEIICDGESWGIVAFTAEEWNWEYLGMGQMNAGRHEIKLINKESQELGDTNVDFTQVRIMWLKE